MAKNYYSVSSDIHIGKFLKNFNDKKLSNFILFDDEIYFVDIPKLALRFKDSEEKIHNYQSKIYEIQTDSKEELITNFFESGQRVVKYNDKIYTFADILNVLKEIIPQKELKKNIDEIEKKEIFALEEQDSISRAKTLFIEKGINLLPIVNSKLEILGEIRPIDLLFLKDNQSGMNYYDKQKANKIDNLSALNIGNNRPLTLKKEQNILDLINLIITKSIPSVIILDEKEQLYSVISYSDILKFYKDLLVQNTYKIEFVNSEEVEPSEFEQIKKYASKFMTKISKFSDYELLKIDFKTTKKTETDFKKFKVFVNLSKGNHVLNVSKDTKNTKEEFSREQGASFLVNECLKNLEDIIKKSKN